MPHSRHAAAERIQNVAPRVRSTFAFFNNRYAGFAPEWVILFRAEMGLPRVDWGSGAYPKTLDSAESGGA